MATKSRRRTSRRTSSTRRSARRSVNRAAHSVASRTDTRRRRRATTSAKDMTASRMGLSTLGKMIDIPREVGSRALGIVRSALPNG